MAPKPANDPNKPLSKNAQKALAKKQAKEARKAKAAAEAEKDKKPEKTVAKRIAPPLPQEPAQKDVVSYGPDRIPLAAMAANALCGGPLTFCCDEGMKGSEPSFVVDGVTVHGSSTAARYAFTTSSQSSRNGSGGPVDRTSQQRFGGNGARGATGGRDLCRRRDLYGRRLPLLAINTIFGQATRQAVAPTPRSEPGLRQGSSHSKTRWRC